MAFYSINLTNLNQINSNLKQEKSNFSKVKANYDASYIKSCSNKTVASMAKNLDEKFLQIEEAYQSIEEWLTNYLNDTEAVENCLAEHGSAGSINESAISGIVSSMQELETVELNLAGTFTGYVGSNINIGNSEIDVDALDPESRKIYEDTMAALLAMGFTKNEVNQLFLGEKSFNDLYSELMQDEERRNKLYEYTVLSPYGFNSIAELEEKINTLQNTIDQLEKEYAQTAEATMVKTFIDRLQQPFVGFVSETEAAIWSYEDINGEKHYTSTRPISTEQQMFKNVVSYSYQDLCVMFPGSVLLGELKENFKDTSDGFLGIGSPKAGFSWDKGKNNQDFINKVTNSQKNAEERRSQLKKEIDEAKAQLSQLTAFRDEAVKQIDYALNDIQNYTFEEDFTLLCGFNFNDKQALDDFFESLSAKSISLLTEGGSQVKVKSEEELATILFAYFNGYGNVEFDVTQNTFRVGKAGTVFTSDMMFKNYGDWGKCLSEKEINVFNYVYKKEGAQAAYDWLKDISNVIDDRYIKGNLASTLSQEQLEKFNDIYEKDGADAACKYAESISPDVVVGEMVKDQLWANENTFHQILASVGSVVITPFEGMNAMINNAYALATDQDIYYSDIYSEGNVYRGAVSQYINEHSNGFWSFLYDTGMSMADSAALIGLNVLTGGTMSWALAPTVMGSRVYVAAVNDGKDRGFTDMEAVLWGLSSALVESWAEYFSLSKFTGLKEQADKILPQLVSKFSTLSDNPTINKITTRFATAAYTSLRQSLSEASEEAVTEVANGFVDTFIIGKDKSNIMLAIKAYEEDGKSSEEAVKLALKDFGNDVFMAWLGGLVSGSVFGTQAGIKASSDYTKYVVSSKTAQALINEYNSKVGPELQINSYTDYVQRQVTLDVQMANAIEELQEKANSITGKVTELANNVLAKGKARVNNVTENIGSVNATENGINASIGSEMAQANAYSNEEESKTIPNDDTITIPLLKKIKEAAVFGANKEVDVGGTLEQLLATGLDMKSIPSEVFLKVTDEYGAHDLFFPTSLKEYNEIVTKMKKYPDKYSSKMGNSLCYDFKTGKVENFGMMRYRLERYNEVAEEVLVNMTKDIAQKATDPHLKEFSKLVRNIKNLSAKWSVIYDATGSACRRGDNVIKLDETAAGNEVNREVMSHELGHSIQNAVNEARVPADYVIHLFKALEYFKSHSATISSFLADVDTNYEQIKAECTEIFEREYAQKIRDTIFSRREALEAYYASYGLDLSKLDSTLEKQYEDAKKQKIFDLFDVRCRNTKYALIQGFINDLFFIPRGESISYIDSDGKLVTLNHLDLGHSDEYNKRFLILETSFHELMAEFTALKSIDANAASVFAEIFGQEFYDYINNFWGETIDCLCTGDGTVHQYESLSESDLALLSMYLKSFGNMVNALAIENISDITEINLNKNNIVISEDGTYDLYDLVEKLTLADRVKLKIDISDMSDVDLRNLTLKIYSNEAENIGNIEYVKDGVVVPIGEAILTKADFEEKVGKYFTICNNLSKITAKARVTVDLTGFTDNEILELGTAIYSYYNPINMDNINFILEDGSSFSFTKVLINETINGYIQPSVYDYVNAIKSIVGKLPIILDVSTMTASEFQSLLSRLASSQVRIGTITFLYNDGYSTKMYPPQQYQKLIDDMRDNQRHFPAKPKTPDVRYDNVELIPPKQDVVDSAPTLSKAFKENLVDGAKRGVQLKQELLASVKGLKNESEIIRTLYLELSKKVHYDMNYIVGDEKFRKSVETSEPLTFENLNDVGTLVCKGWSELYQEILIAAGIDPARVSIKGKLHRWVEIDMGNDNIIIADATQVIEGFPADDLATTKVGMPTCGFMMLNKGYSGYNPREIYELLDNTKYTEKQRQGFAKAIAISDKNVLALDKKLRYASPRGYYADQLTQAKKLFGDGKLSKLFGHEVNPEQVKIDTINKLINMDLSTMSGDEVYVYMRHIMEKVFGEKANGPYLAYHKTEYGAEAVAIVSLQEGGHGRCLVYSEALGKQIINNQDLTKFMKDNAILYKNQYKSAYIDPPKPHQGTGTREIPKVHNTEQLPKVDTNEELYRTEELFPAGEGGN